MVVVGFDLLREYLRLVAIGQRPDPAPVGMAEAVAKIAFDIAAGRMPPLISRAVKRGRANPGYGENRDIKVAVAYIKASTTEGLLHEGEIVQIADPDPIKTIHMWYGAAKRTIYEWRQKQALNSRSLGANPINGDILVRLTWAAAQRYRQGSRTLNSTRDRGRKPKHR